MIGHLQKSALGLQMTFDCFKNIEAVETQVTALLTPTLASLAGDKPGRSVWAGCGVAMAGGCSACLLLCNPQACPGNPGLTCHLLWVIRNPAAQP